MSRASACLLLLTGFLFALGGLGCGSNPGVDSRQVVLLTTTTTQDSGILDVLVAEFEKRHPYRVKAIVSGSGDVLKKGASGEGDVLLTHSPQAERDWLKQGHGVAGSRRLVMYNDFVVIGPPGDPAGIKGLAPAAAFQKIAAVRAAFVSRGDDSGTHVRELAVWKKAGVNPDGQGWYSVTGQGQGQTIQVASEHQAYALTDRGTFLRLRRNLDLQILVERDPALLNIYHVMQVNPVRFPKVNAAGGNAWADFLVSDEGQAVIGRFGRAEFGQPLFTPAANTTEEKLLPRE